jgi:hypothetical protein
MPHVEPFSLETARIATPIRDRHEKESSTR